MCLAIPLLITDINKNEAVCEADGIRRTVRIDFIKDPAVGDYIISHAGFAIEKLSERQARLNLEAIREVSDASL